MEISSIQLQRQMLNPQHNGVIVDSCPTLFLCFDALCFIMSIVHEKNPLSGQSSIKQLFLVGDKIGRLQHELNQILYQFMKEAKMCSPGRSSCRVQVTNSGIS